MDRTRRALLIWVAGLLPVSLAGTLSMSTIGCSPSSALCYDPDLLSTPEKSLRTSLAFTDVSPFDGKDGGELKRCGGCQFFRAAAEEGCGECQILGGPVSAASVCNSWSIKAA